jgi:hypothetical protein
VAGIGRAGRHVVPPELGESRLQEPIDDGRTTLAHRLWGHQAAPYIEPLSVRQSLVPHGDPLEPRPGPQPIQRQPEPVLERGPVEVFPGGRTPTDARQVDPEVRLVQDIQETRHGPSLAELHLQREPMAGFGLGRQGGELDPACGLRQNLDVGMARQGAIQRGEFVTPLVLDLLEKVRCLGGELECGLIRRAVDLKVLGDSLIRVPRAISPDDPKFCAAELVAPGLQDTHLVGATVDPLAPLGIGVDHGLAPVVPDDPLQRDVLLDGIGAHATGEIALEERERPDERLVGGVVRAQFQGLEERRQHPAIGGAGGAAPDRLEVRTLEGSRRVPLLDESTERGLPDDRNDHLVDHAGRVIEAGLGQAREHAGCPMHALEVFAEGFFNLPFRLGAKAVDEFQQHLHQDIRECSPAEQTEGRQEGHSEWHGMPAELMGFFDRNPLALRVEHARGQVVAQVRGEVQGPDAFQRGELRQEVVQRRAPRVRPEFLEQGACEGGGGVSVRAWRLHRTSEGLELPWGPHGPPVQSPVPDAGVRALDR